ncbi:MAG: hypothetical protein R3D88_00340 [Alphaproteobacteria bacterium]|nr:hypothetical protein [Alphaproteobacteria bacterium]
MLKLSAIIVGTYLMTMSSVFATEETSHDVSVPAELLAEGTNLEEVAHHAAEGAEHASKGGLPQFDPEWFASQVFWLAISFAVLYIIFSKKTLPEISGVIENRKNHIQSNLDSAEKLTAEADAVHDAYNENLAKAQTTASEAIHSAESEMKAKAASALDNFRERSEQELQAAEKRIRSSQRAAMGEMNAIAAEAASVAVEKIIGTTDANKVKAIVENMNGKAKAA